MSKEQIKQIAIEGVLLVKKLLPELPDTEIQLEYSPESFSDTEVDYALEVCEAVMDAWEPTSEFRSCMHDGRPRRTAAAATVDPTMTKMPSKRE